MDLMNEAMKRRKANGLEITITVQKPGAAGKEAQMAADKGSDLAPNPMGEEMEAEEAKMDPDKGEEMAEGEMMGSEPMRKGSVSDRAHQMMMAKMKGKKA